MADLTIYRNAVLVATVNIDEKTILTKKLMNEDKVSADFITDAVIPIELGDYIVVNGKNYYLNSLPAIEKINNNTIKYSVFFFSELYDLYNKLLISSDGLSDFSYVGTAHDLLTMIVENMNKISVGWAVGVVDESSEKTLDFVNESCRTALTKITEAFQFEFGVIDKTINLQKAIGTVREITFEYGKNKGLYAIERRQIDNRSVYTKVYGYGGTKNIPHTYRDRAKRLVFEERFLEKNVGVFGIREGQFTNEDIYPHRTGTLTAIDILFTAEKFNVNESWIEDTSIDFNINDYLLEGLTAKIVFKSGQLSGSQFEVWKYDHATKRLYFNPFNDTDGYVLPNMNNKPKVGDTYTLVDIAMPHIYIIKAEQDLKDATQVFLDDNSVPKSLYIVKIDTKYAKANNILLDAGDLVKVKDTQLGIDRAIRIAEVSFPLVNPYQITAIIADFIPYTLEQRITKATVATNKVIQSITNKITNIQNNTNNTSTTNNNNITNIYATEYPEPNIVVINGRAFTFEKAFDNYVNPTILEVGDLIYGNFWDRYTYVKKWMYLGGNTVFPESWDRIETIDYTPG